MTSDNHSRFPQPSSPRFFHYLNWWLHVYPPHTYSANPLLFTGSGVESIWEIRTENSSLAVKTLIGTPRERHTHTHTHRRTEKGRARAKRESKDNLILLRTHVLPPLNTKKSIFNGLMWKSLAGLCSPGQFYSQYPQYLINTRKKQREIR